MIADILAYIILGIFILVPLAIVWVVEELRFLFVLALTFVTSVFALAWAISRLWGPL